MQPWVRFLNKIPSSGKAAGLTWLWIALLHPDVFFHPNAQLLASSRDAVKNIYTLAWQWAHGAPFSFEFAGMGWPFTEHVFYTDGHPLMAWLTSGWLFPHILTPDWTVGILHGAIILSWGLAAACTVKILERFEVVGTVAVLAASFLALQHPQILRWTGHYALAYGVAIPLTWYLHLRWLQQPSRKNTYLNGANIAFWLLTHAYLGAVAAAFAGIMGGIAAVQNRMRTWRLLGQVVMATVAPLVLYTAILAATDAHPFRTDRPFGFWDNVTRWNAAMLPSHGPLGEIRYNLGWGLTTWEGWGYLGTGTWLVLVAAPIFFLLDRFRRQPRRRPMGGLGAALVASIVLYAVAVGEPFLTGKENWLEQTKLFLQFRAIGRFTWPAVWVFPVAALCWANRRKNLWWLGAVTLFMGLDAWWMHREARLQMDLQPNGFAQASMEVQELQRVANAQESVAIHPVPWFQMGSETVGREGSLVAHRSALFASYHTGLPLTATHLTRMSIPESRLLAEWMGYGAGNAGLRSALSPDSRNGVVLLYACDDPEEWQPDDHRMWEQGQPTAYPHIRLLHLHSFFDGQPPHPVFAKTADDWHWNGLNDEPFDHALEGQGVRSGRHNEYLVVDTLYPDSAWLNQPVESTCWFWHGGDHSGRDALKFEWVAEALWPNGERAWLQTVPVASAGDHLNHWTRARLVFQLDSLPEALLYFAVGFESVGDSIRADAFRVRPRGEIPPK